MGGQANTNSTFGSSNFSGSIQANVSANTTAGFSIVSYTGTGSNATVGHGLGSALDFIIVKRNNTTSWCTTGTVNGWDKSLFLDTTDQNGSYTFWQSTAPTSSVFSIDGSSAVNGSSDTFIAYCFAEKKDLVSSEATQEMVEINLSIQDLSQLS